MSGSGLQAAVFNVGTLANLITRINAANPGDQIILSNGVYTSTSYISITRSGTATKPILITAQTIGGAQIVGAPSGSTSGFNLNGCDYVIIQGFYFTHTNDANIGDYFRVESGSSHCRITRNTFDFDPVQYWCYVKGDDIEVDHNIFQNKVQKGEYITLDGNYPAIGQRLWAHDNYFFNNQYAGSNGGENIRLGIGVYQLISSWGVVENNLFEQADGDPETISVKSSDCVIRYNTLTNSTGQISLRSQNRGRVEGNFMLNSSGIRFYGDDDLIFNNYLQGSDGIVFGSGEAAQISDSYLAANAGIHAVAHRARVMFNTLVNCSVYFDEDSRGYFPSDFIVANNLLQGNSGSFLSSAAAAGQINFTWQTNIFWGSASYAGSPAGGYWHINPLLATNTAVPFHIAANSPATNAAFAAIAEVLSDMDGQPRVGTPDIGADEVSSAPVTRRPLTTNDVGPYVAATNFAIVAMPWSQTVMPGRGTSYTNLVSSYNGFTNTVTLSVANLPAGITASFNPASVAYGTNGFGLSVLSVTTSNTAPPGRYTLPITATSSAFTNTTLACLTVGNLPANWTDADIGNPASAGSADNYLNVFAVKGGGAQISGTADQFNLTYQPWTNGLLLTARVATQPGTSPSAEAGVMIRETTNANSKFVEVVLTPVNINMKARTTTGGSAVPVATFTPANSPVGTNSPCWVRLNLSGSAFTGYVSSNGVIWVQMGVTNISMTNTLAGLAVCAADNTQLNTSTFDNVNFLSTNNAPVITSQPTNQSVLSGNNASFVLGAGGDAPLSYQWWFNTNSILAGSTNTLLTITNAQGTNAGSYSVVVTNAHGSVTSAVVTLTVNVAPVITNQPANQSVTLSNNATFLVGASGTIPLSYQWWFNTKNLLAGATNAALIITNAQSTNAGSYLVIVTNLYGSATSAVATLTVNTSSGISVTNFTNAGTWSWTCPTNVISVQVECWGGGGAGGSANKTNTSSWGGGGAGGAYARKASIPVTPGNSYAIAVGGGGVNNSAVNGTRVNGTNTTFTGDGGITVTAAGGQGGATAIDTGGGPAGTGATTGCIGDPGTIFAGGNGVSGVSSYGGGGGAGAGNNTIGASASTSNGGAGANGGGSGGNGALTGAPGSPGSAPGGGGGGARMTGAAGLQAGGTGGAGQAILSYYAAPTVTSSVATGIGTTTATLNGNAADNGNAISERGFFYKTSSGVSTNDTQIVTGSGAGAFTAAPALSANTHYYWKAYAINVGGTVLSAELDFITLVPTPPVFTNLSMSGDQAAFTLTGTGAANQPYVLQTALSLNPPLTWTPLATNNSGPDGVFSFTDNQTTNFTQRFYRVMQP